MYGLSGFVSVEGVDLGDFSSTEIYLNLIRLVFLGLDLGTLSVERLIKSGSTSLSGCASVRPIEKKEGYFFWEHVPSFFFP